MENEALEFSMEQVLSLLTSINDTAKNITLNILEIQTQNQQAIIESLKER